MQPCPSLSPCCLQASTAAVTPGSICASLGISFMTWGRTFCAVPLATSSHPNAAVSVTLTPATRATRQPLPSRAPAVRGASHRHPPRKPPGFIFFCLPCCPLSLSLHAAPHKFSSGSISSKCLSLQYLLLKLRRGKTTNTVLSFRHKFII